MMIGERIKLMKSLGKDDLVKFLSAEHSINVEYWISSIICFVMILSTLYKKSFFSFVFISFLIVTIIVYYRDTKLLRSKFKRVL